MDDPRAGIDFVVSEDYDRDEKTVYVKGLSFQEVTETTSLQDLQKNEWKTVEVIRRIGQDGLMLKIVDKFKNGKNIYHNETSTAMNSQRDQFDRLWIQNWVEACEKDSKK